MSFPIRQSHHGFFYSNTFKPIFILVLLSLIWSITNIGSPYHDIWVQTVKLDLELHQVQRLFLLLTFQEHLQFHLLMALLSAYLPTNPGLAMPYMLYLCERLTLIGLLSLKYLLISPIIMVQHMSKTLHYEKDQNYLWLS